MLFRREQRTVPMTAFMGCAPRAAALSPAMASVMKPVGCGIPLVPDTNAIAWPQQLKVSRCVLLADKIRLGALQQFLQNRACLSNLIQVLHVIPDTACLGVYTCSGTVCSMAM